MQEFSSIEKDVTEETVFNLYSQSYALRCDKLLRELTNHIIQKLLTIHNVAHFYLDSIEFQNDELRKVCEAMIVQKFPQMDKTYILGLPAKFFTNILSSDDLNIKSESDLIELIREYFERHKSTTPNAPVKPEDQAGPYVWGLLNDAERKTRTDAYNKQVTEKATKDQAILDQDSKQYYALTDAKKKE